MWFIYGFPLVLLGVAWIWAGASSLAGESYDTYLIAFGVVYVVAGVLSLFKTKETKLLAQIAWCPVLLAFPIGTVVGVLAIRLLRHDTEKVKEHHESVQRFSDEDLRDLIAQEARGLLGITADKVDLDMEADLGLPPGEIAMFFDDLEVDHGLVLPPDVRKRATSLAAVLEAFTVQPQNG